MRIREFIGREITNRKKLPRNTAILALALFISMALYFSPFLLFSSGRPQLEEAAFVRAVDGDTVVVEVNQQQVTVRLIGINTPESTNCSVQKCDDAGEKASSFTKGYFNKGQKLFLEYDKGRTDKYGRTLAYIWLRNDVRFNFFADFRRYCFNAVLLDNTDCQAQYYSPNGKYRRWLEHIEILNRVNR